MFDPKPSQEKIISEYFHYNNGKPYLVTCTCKHYYLTKLEAFLVKYRLLSIKTIDRKQTRIARYDITRATLANKIKKKGRVNPFMWSDPITGKPILFTSMGVVYRLSIIDRLMLKFGKTNVTALNKKAVGLTVIHQTVEQSYHDYVSYPGYLHYYGRDD
jgi:hypothetical protein